MMGSEPTGAVWEGHTRPHLCFHMGALSIKLFAGNWYDLLLGVSFGLV